MISFTIAVYHTEDDDDDDMIEQPGRIVFKSSRLIA